MNDTRQTPTRKGAPHEVERRARALRKRRDAAAVLTILGVVLFASPLVSAIGAADTETVVPMAVQYVFNIWAVLIAAAFVLSRVLSGREDDAASHGGVDTSAGEDAPRPSDTTRA